MDEDTAQSPDPAHTLTLDVGDPEQGAAGVTTTITANTNPGLFSSIGISGSGVTRTVSYRPTPNGNGTAQVTITADDGQTCFPSPACHTDTHTFLITVTAVDDCASLPSSNPPNGNWGCTPPVASGSGCTLNCDSGYEAGGDGIADCTDETWSSVDTCSPMGCTSSPADPSHGQYASCDGSADGGTCALTCNTGYYATGDGEARCSLGAWTSVDDCDPCESYCDTCTDGTTCTACTAGYFFLAGDCYATCPTGYYGNSGQCLTCESYCDTCTDATTCTACLAGYYVHAGDCVTSCPTGYFANGGACAACEPFCDACTDATTCTACENGLYVLDGDCVVSCPGGYDPVAGVCVKRCGNNTVDPGEECDDGNQIPNDGCEPDCTETCGPLEVPHGVEAYYDSGSCAYRFVAGAEPLTNLQKIYKGAALYRAQARVDSDGDTVACAYPTNQAVTPVEGSCCQSLGGPDSDGDDFCDQTDIYWDTDTWSSLGFGICGAHKYLYEWSTSTTPFQVKLTADDDTCSTCLHRLTLTGVEKTGDTCVLEAPTQVSYSFCEGGVSNSASGTITLTASQQAGFLPPSHAIGMNLYEHEVNKNLDRILAEAVEYYEDNCAWPSNQYMTPVEGTCCQALGGPDNDGDNLCDLTNTYWQTSSWSAVEFMQSDPHAFVYALDRVTKGPATWLKASAYGDLDCDNFQSTFARFVKPVTSTPPCTAAVVTGRYTENEADGCACMTGCYDWGTCGDGTKDAGESCDDGNRVNGDGCDVDCTVSCSWVDVPPGLEVIQAGVPGDCDFAFKDGVEPLTHLQRMYKGATVYRGETRLDTNGDAVVCGDPSNQAVTPVEGSCCQSLGGPDNDGDDLCDLTQIYWDTQTWAALGFGLENPHAWLAKFTSGGASGQFKLTLTADDANCSTYMHELTLTGVEKTTDRCVIEPPTRVAFKSVEDWVEDAHVGWIDLTTAQQSGFVVPASIHSANPHYGEASDHLNQIIAGAVSYYQSNCAWPSNQATTPVEGTCCQSLGGPDSDGDDVCDNTSTYWQTTAWQQVGFSLSVPHRFVYSMSTFTHSGETWFKATANGDTNCDNSQSAFTRFARPLDNVACFAEAVDGMHSTYEAEGQYEDTAAWVDLCGNSTTDPGEECDDGNQIPNDGCEPDCTETCGPLEVPHGVEAYYDSGSCAYRFVAGAEPLTNLQKIYKGAALYRAQARVDSDGDTVACAYPTNQAVTPVEGSCCQSLGGPDSDGDDFCDQTDIYWDTDTWSSLGFGICGAHKYLYEWSTSTTPFQVKLTADDDTCSTCLHRLTLTGVEKTGDTCVLEAPTQVSYSFCEGGVSNSASGTITLTASQQAGFLPPSHAIGMNLYEHEVNKNLDRILAEAVEYYEDNCAWPSNQYMTPVEGTCCQALGGPDNDGDNLCDLTNTYWQTSSWSAVEFMQSDPHAFVYALDRVTKGPATWLKASAYGDLDCDNFQSTFARFVKPVTSTPPCTAAVVTGRYTENEADGCACMTGCYDWGTCGDGTKDAGESCDDGNRVNGDGCDVDCTVSCSWVDVPPGLEVIQAGVPGDCDFAFKDGVEPLTHLQRMYKGATVYRGETRLDTNGDAVVCGDPSNQAVTPVEGSCCQSLGGPDNDGDDLCDLTQIYWDTQTWAALGFGLENPHAWLAKFTSGGASGQFKLTLTADDANCSTYMHELTLTGVEKTTDRCVIEPPTRVAFKSVEDWVEDAHVGWIDLTTAQQSGFVVPASIHSANPHYGEASDHLNQIIAGAVSYYQSNCAWPSNQATTPVEGTCCQSLGGPDSDGDDVCDNTSTYWQTTAWQQVGFSLSVPHRFVYSMSTFTHSGETWFKATANGDTNCDNSQSAFARFAKPLTTTAPCTATAVEGTYSSYEGEGQYEDTTVWTE